MARSRKISLFVGARDWLGGGRGLAKSASLVVGSAAAVGGTGRVVPPSVIAQWSVTCAARSRGVAGPMLAVMR